MKSTKPLSRDQVRRIDRLCTERYGIPGLILMENAGKNAAAIIESSYGPDGRAFVACGTGNNGGDGFVIARQLHNLGWDVRIALCGDPDKMSPDCRTNHAIASAMRLPIVVCRNGAEVRQAGGLIEPNDVIVDALLGTGFSGNVRSPIVEMIALVNQSKKRAVVAVDVPSGLDCDTGAPADCTIRADLTITFVAPKVGFDAQSARPFLGRVVSAGIGAPKELVAQITGE